jgi:recombination protein RecT
MPEPQQNNNEKQKEAKALVERKKHFFGQLHTEMEKRKDEFARLLPKYLTPERFFAIAYQAVARTPEMQECTIESLLRCAMQSAELGLELGGVKGHAYMVPFNNKKTGRKEAQFIPGYRGLAHLTLQAGGVQKVWTNVVYKGEKFEVELGSEPRLFHTPAPLGPRKNEEIVGFYAVAKLANGEVQFDVMSKADVDAIRARSKARDNGPWVSDYPEMGKKTVFRRLQKWLPMTDGHGADRLAKALELDNEATRLDEGAVETTGTPMPSELLDEMEKAEGQEGERPGGDEREEFGDFQANIDPISEPQRMTIENAIRQQGITEADQAGILKRHGFKDLAEVTAGKMGEVLRDVLAFNKKGQGAHA